MWKKRSYCGTLTTRDLNKTATVCGWIDTVRDHGQLLFIHLRDHTGLIQILFDPKTNAELYRLAETLRPEFVIIVDGLVAPRSADTVNKNLPTGEIEIRCEKLELINKAQTPPFLVTEKGAQQEEAATFNVDEELRLRYRYLDLRRPSMQQKLRTRSRFIKIMRDYLDEHNFIEVETPCLTKSTPEGARDYLVPSRIHAGKFYALPQSPQLFKQMLMMGGLDRYYQVARCFRDEDLRPNRQPEFTQLDIEASFINEAFIMEMIEGLFVRLFSQLNIPCHAPFKRITYDEAMSVYGSDRPDLRFDLKIQDVTDVLKTVNYKIIQTIIANGGVVKGLNLKGQSAALSKNVLQEEFAKKLIPSLGAKGMTWMRMENGQLDSNIVQFFSESERSALIQAMGAENGDVLIFIADTNIKLVHEVLGKFRLYIAERQNLIPKNTYACCWVIDFPLFELAEGRLSSVHHPFTAPQVDIRNLSDKECLGVKARAYDIVINGEEVGGGSIRNHQPEIQAHIFDRLGLTQDEIKNKFGFFVQALNFGTPIHGGIALGLDRLISMLLGEGSIREVIAFPKNRVALCPLTQAPDAVSDKQLKELSIKVQEDLT